MTKALRSTRVLTPQGFAPASVIVDNGRISSVRGWNESPPDADLFDFGELWLLPGLVDTHVHINDPGRSEWEGFETATRAAAAGGVTTLVDMPLNCVPETIGIQALEAKRSAALGKTWVDWAAWGGVVRGNAEQIKPLARAGVAGFKCFLIHSGVDGFAWVDEADLRASLERLRGTGVPLLVHAEVCGPVDEALRELKPTESSWRRYITYLASRPQMAESDAIALLVRLAEEFRTPVHVVHLSSAGAALSLLDSARRHGLPFTVETCPHYLWFAAEEIPDGATEYKCAPPIRSTENRERLWKALEEGRIDMVATDHSPCLPEMKRRDTGRFDQAWGGVSSLGLALPVMWTGMQQRGIKAGRLAEWVAAAPARLAGLAGSKGSLVSGADADLAVFDPHVSWTVNAADLHFRHKLSPYLGAHLRGRVLETWLRGEPVYRRGEFLGAASGREQVRP